MEIGSLIKSIRLKKGISQEELANKSTLSLRTIQRIENNENAPRGKTAQLLCEALGVAIEDLLDHDKKTDPQFLMFFHLSVLSTIVMPMGNIILPLILWLTNKNKVQGLQSIGARLLNFQIVFQAVTFIVTLLAIFQKIEALDIIELFLILGLLFIGNLAAAIVFAVMNYRGKKITYPSIIPMIK